jgi:hypothetical protein
VEGNDALAEPVVRELGAGGDNAMVELGGGTGGMMNDPLLGVEKTWDVDDTAVGVESLEEELGSLGLGGAWARGRNTAH